MLTPVGVGIHYLALQILQGWKDDSGQYNSSRVSIPPRLSLSLCHALFEWTLYQNTLLLAGSVNISHRTTIFSTPAMTFAAITPPQTAYDTLPSIPAKDALNLPPSPPPSKRTDSAVSFSSCAEQASVKLQRFVAENSKYDAEWGAYLGLAERNWRDVAKERVIQERASEKEGNKSRNDERYEREWSVYLGLDGW